MKEQYTNLEVEVVIFESSDVITTSVSDESKKPPFGEGEFGDGF